MPRKPMNLSVVEGRGKKHLTKSEKEERKQREEALKGNSDKVIAPEWLDDIAENEWNRVIDELIELEIVTNVDVSSLAIACDSLSKYIQAMESIEQFGLVYEEETNAGTKRVKNPAVTVQKQYADIYKQYMSEFGLSPSSRLKLVVPKKGEGEPSEFDKKFGDV